MKAKRLKALFLSIALLFVALSSILVSPAAASALENLQGTEIIIPANTIVELVETTKTTHKS